MNPSIKQFLSTSTAKLTATYLGIIMLMSIGFSIVFYNTTSRALYRQVPANDRLFINQQYGSNDAAIAGASPIHDFLANRAAEGRRELIWRLVLINSLVLSAGGLLSYYLARRNLEPIEAAMEAQAQFVNDASHELRTPLTAIQTSNEVALRNPKLSLAQAKRLINDNTAEVAKLQQLSDGLLNLARYDQAPPDLTPVSVQAAATAALNQVIHTAQAKQVAVDDQLPNLKVQATESGLSQVLVILLDNAIKYSKPGSAVRLTADQKGNNVAIHVTDEGVGIRASDLPHVFRRFYRADSARSAGHEQGYGLGLAIADSLVQSFGGTISAESQIDKGSTFTIKLPEVK